MELEDVIKMRRSIRKFSTSQIPDGLLDELLLLSRGPSAGGIRGYQAIITQQQLSPYNAPVHVVICTDPEVYAPRYGNRGRELYAVQDATIFAAYFQLLLVNRGLASCWVGAFKEHKIQHAVSTELRPIAVIAVGFAQ